MTSEGIPVDKPDHGHFIRGVLTSVISVRALGYLSLAAASCGVALIAPGAFVAPAAVLAAGAYAALLEARGDLRSRVNGDSRISFAKMLERQIESGRRISIQDRATGLLQKWYFDLRVAEEVNRCKRYGVPMALIRLAAPANARRGDTWGTETEWQLAQEVEHRLRAVDISARIGGLEFIACLPHTDLRGAQVAARRILKDLEGWSLTVGFATYPTDGEDADMLIEAAVTCQPTDWSLLAEIVEFPPKKRYDDLISRLHLEETAEIELLATETPRQVKQRLRRASKRLGVSLEIWSGEGRLYCKRTEETARRKTAA